MSLTPPGLIDHPTFRCGDVTIEHFVHRYNTGTPPFRMTERTIELALADLFLRANSDDVLEIGAVTPYYWPRRVTRIADPTDPHPAVTDRVTWEDVRVDGRSLLSISTFEHIGTGDYGIAATASVHAAIDKLLSAEVNFLVTFPPCYNQLLDTYVASVDLSESKSIALAWNRGTRGNRWVQRDFKSMLGGNPKYGATGATALAALIRTPNLDWLRA